jgi:hypothetical protein
MRKRTYPRLRMADLPVLGRSSVPPLTAVSWRDDVRTDAAMPHLAVLSTELRTDSI